MKGIRQRSLSSVHGKATLSAAAAELQPEPTTEPLSVTQNRSASLRLSTGSHANAQNVSHSHSSHLGESIHSLSRSASRQGRTDGEDGDADDSVSAMEGSRSGEQSRGASARKSHPGGKQAGAAMSVTPPFPNVDAIGQPHSAAAVPGSRGASVSRQFYFEPQGRLASRVLKERVAEINSADTNTDTTDDALPQPAAKTKAPGHSTLFNLLNAVLDGVEAGEEGEGDNNSEEKAVVNTHSLLLKQAEQGNNSFVNPSDEALAPWIDILGYGSSMDTTDTIVSTGLLFVAAAFLAFPLVGTLYVAYRCGFYGFLRGVELLAQVVAFRTIYFISYFMGWTFWAGWKSLLGLALQVYRVAAAVGVLLTHLVLSAHLVMESVGVSSSLFDGGVAGAAEGGAGAATAAAAAAGQG